MNLYFFLLSLTHFNSLVLSSFTQISSNNVDIYNLKRLIFSLFSYFQKNKSLIALNLPFLSFFTLAYSFTNLVSNRVDQQTYFIFLISLSVLLVLNYVLYNILKEENYKQMIWIPTNHRSVKIKFHKHRLNGVHEAEPDTWISHLFYN